MSTNVASCGELREVVDLYDTLPGRICAADAHANGDLDSLSQRCRINFEHLHAYEQR